MRHSPALFLPVPFNDCHNNCKSSFGVVNYAQTQVEEKIRMRCTHNQEIIIISQAVKHQHTTTGW